MRAAGQTRRLGLAILALLLLKSGLLRLGCCNPAERIGQDAEVVKIVWEFSHIFR
jgi:hypothetical protein